MGRSKSSYNRIVHYPEDKNGMLLLRKRMGTAYIGFVKNYILNLPISDEKKNELYSNIIDRLKS